MTRPRIRPSAPNRKRYERTADNPGLLSVDSHNVVEIYHDGIDRRSLFREFDPTRTGSCSWCGSKPGVYRYQWVGDDKSRYIKFTGPWFCTVECNRSYSL